MKTIRVLVTACDIGAAHHLLYVARGLRASPGFSVSVYACEAAADLFALQGEPFVWFGASPKDRVNPESQELEALRLSVRHVLDEEVPDVVLCGLSTFGNGLDETMIATAGGAPWRRPTVLFMDDRGPLPDFHGSPPEYIFATSKSIVEWVSGRTRAKVYMVGSPKHYVLSQLPVEELRQKGRGFLQVDDGTLVVTFFAQGSFIPGHDANFLHLIGALAEQQRELGQYLLVIRSHPSFPETGRLCYGQARAWGLDAVLDSGMDITQLLCSTDVLFCCASTVVLDFLALEGSRRPPVYLLIGEEIREWLRTRYGDWCPPPVAEGRTIAVTEREALGAVVRSLLGRHALAQPAARAAAHHEDGLGDPVLQVVTTLQDIVLGERNCVYKRG